MSGVLASYPLDTIKIRMQTQDISKIYYKNSLDCVKQMYKKDGIKVFYRGIEAPLLTYGIIKSITFGSYGNLLDYYKQKRIQNIHGIINTHMVNYLQQGVLVDLCVLLL